MTQYKYFELITITPRFMDFVIFDKLFILAAILYSCVFNYNKLKAVQAFKNLFIKSKFTT